MTTAAMLSRVFQALILYMGFLIPQDTLSRELLLSPLYERENCGSEWLGDWLRATQQR